MQPPDPVSAYQTDKRKETFNDISYSPIIEAQKSMKNAEIKKINKINWAGMTSCFLKEALCALLHTPLGYEAVCLLGRLYGDAWWNEILRGFENEHLYCQRLIFLHLFTETSVISIKETYHPS